jgi:hypothetical protein
MKCERINRIAPPWQRSAVHSEGQSGKSPYRVRRRVIAWNPFWKEQRHLTGRLLDRNSLVNTDDAMPNVARVDFEPDDSRRTTDARCSATPRARIRTGRLDACAAHDH